MIYITYLGEESTENFIPGETYVVVDMKFIPITQDYKVSMFVTNRYNNVVSINYDSLTKFNTLWHVENIVHSVDNRQEYNVNKNELINFQLELERIVDKYKRYYGVNHIYYDFVSLSTMLGEILNNIEN